MTILADLLIAFGWTCLGVVVCWILWYAGLAVMLGFAELTDPCRWQRISDKEFRRQLAKIEREIGCACGQLLCPGCRRGGAIRRGRNRRHAVNALGPVWVVTCRRHRTQTTGDRGINPHCWHCDCEVSGLSTRRQIRRSLREHPRNAVERPGWWIRRMRLDGGADGLQMRGLIVRHRS